MEDKTNTGNVVGNAEFKSKGDWINRLIDENCSTIEGAVEAVPAVTDDDGKVTTPAVRGRKGKKITDLASLAEIAEANGITVKDYPNAGMARMNIGNMLRAAAKKRHGLNVGGVWVEAPEDFEVNEEKTENPDGTKIPKAKPQAEGDDTSE